MSLVYAGIQPFTIINGKLILLLGEESDDKTWSSFGGSPEYVTYPFDLENALEEALRELNEESFGILGSIDEIREKIDINHFSLGNDNRAITFFLYLDISNIQIANTMVKDYKNMFDFLYNFTNITDDEGLFEKSQINFFSIDEIRKGSVILRDKYDENFETLLSDLFKLFK